MTTAKKTCCELKCIDCFADMDFPKLMEIYYESNTDNVPFLFPECEDRDSGRLLVEKRFREYLQEFFETRGNRYYVLTSGDQWIAAIRLFPVPDCPGSYYAEALETRPECRRQGYGRTLFRLLFESLSKDGDFEVTDSVSRKNEASLKLHLSCGFEVYQETSVCILNGYENPNAYGMRFSSAAQRTIS